jgi:hypothetical protein
MVVRITTGLLRVAGTSFTFQISNLPVKSQSLLPQPVQHLTDVRPMKNRHDDEIMFATLTKQIENE